MKKLLKLTSLAIALLVVATVFAVGANADNRKVAFAETDYNAVAAVSPSGAGTADDAYVLSSVENFKWLDENLATLKGKFFVLGSDVDFSGVTGFYPIGIKSGDSFVGTFDGNGHSVLNLEVGVAIGNGSAGLFAKSGSGAKFKNLTLQNVNVKSPFNSVGGYLVQNVGSLVGAAIGTTFENITVDGGEVSGKTIVGGLVGSANDCAFTHVRTHNSVKVNYGNLSSEGVAGGIVGGYNLERNNRAMEYCYSLSAIEGSAEFKNSLGGLIGSLALEEFEENKRKVTRRFDFSFCYFAGTLDAAGSEAEFGSFTSNNLSSDNVVFNKCLHSNQNKTASENIYPYANGVGYISGVTGLSRAQLKNPSEVIARGWSFAGDWIIDLSKSDLEEFGSYPDFDSAYAGNYVNVYFVEMVSGLENNNSDKLNYKGTVRFVKGNVINLVFATPVGYHLGEFTIGEVNALDAVVDGQYSFTVPAEATTIRFAFTPKQYNVIISNSAEGTVNIGGRVEEGKDDFNADYNSLVTFSVTPDRYYDFLSISFTDETGKAVKFNEIERGKTYSFVLKGNTTVSVEWKKKIALFDADSNLKEGSIVEVSIDGAPFAEIVGKDNEVLCGTKIVVRTKATSASYRLTKWQYSVSSGVWVNDVVGDKLAGTQESGAYFSDGYYYYETIVPDGINESIFQINALYLVVKNVNLKIASLEGGTFKVSENNELAVVTAIDGVAQAEQNCAGSSFVWEEGKTYTIVMEVNKNLFIETKANDGYKLVIKKGNANVGSILPKADGETFVLGYEKIKFTLSLSTKNFDSNYFMVSDTLNGKYSRLASANSLSGELGKEVYIAYHLGSSKFKGWLTKENGRTINDFGAGAFEKGVNFWDDVDVDGEGKRFVVFKYVFGKDTASSAYADNVSLWSVALNKNFDLAVGDAYIYSVNNKRTEGFPDSVNVENGSKIIVYVKVAPNYSLDFSKFSYSNSTQKVEKVGDEYFNVFLIEIENINQFTGISLHIGRSPVKPSLSANNSRYGTVEARNAYQQLYVGDKLTVVATPLSGYKFSHWQVTTANGTENVKTSTYVHTIVGADDRLIAVFVSTESSNVTYTVSLRAGKGIKIVGGEEEFYYSGDTVSIYAETKSGYEFDGWYNTLTGAKISGNINYDFAIASDIVLEARAVEKTFKVEIRAVTGGEITCSPSKTEYNLGDRITFTFTEKEGYKFSGWQVNGSDYEASGKSFTITISKDISISATAEEISGGNQAIIPETTYIVEISVNDSAYGYVEYSTKKIIKGGSVSMTAYAKSSDYEFKYWVRDNVPVSTEATYVLTDVQNDCTMVAYFEPAKRTLAYTTTDTEAVNIEVTADKDSVGSLETISATARLGYKITKVTIKGLGANAFADDNNTPIYDNGVWIYSVGGKTYKYYENTGEWELEIDGKSFTEDLVLNNNVAVHIDTNKTGYTAIEWLIALGVTLLLLVFLVAVVLVMKAQPNDSVKKIISEMKGEKYKAEMADAAAGATVITAQPQPFAPQQFGPRPMGPQGMGMPQNPNAPMQGAGMPQNPNGIRPQQPMGQPPMGEARPNGFVPNGNMQRPPMTNVRTTVHNDDVPDYDPDDDDD